MRMILLSLVFLSSAAHAEIYNARIYPSGGGLGGIYAIRTAAGADLPQAPRGLQRAEPIPYAGLDISRVFDPRHDLYMLQLESLRHEDIATTLAKRMADHFAAHDNSNSRTKTWWDNLSTEQKMYFWLVCVAILMTIYALLKFNREKPNLTGKR